MAEEKRKRINFSQQELDFIKTVVLKYPIVEKKLHDKQTEHLRKVAWNSIVEEYNAHAHHVKRSVPQLKGAWKRIKRTFKSQKAAERSTFKTGVGDQSPAAEEDRDMDEMFSEQTPSLNVPDDDDFKDDGDDSLECIISTEGRSPTPNIDNPSASATLTTTGLENRESSLKTFGKKKTQRKVDTFAEQFYNKRMEYLKQEHELKMKILQEEMRYWKAMKRNALEGLLQEPQRKPQKKKLSNLGGIMTQ